MKKYTIKVGETFTQEKADELIEYLEEKDGGILKAKRDLAYFIIQQLVNDPIIWEAVVKKVSGKE